MPDSPKIDGKPQTGCLGFEQAVIFEKSKADRRGRVVEAIVWMCMCLGQLRNAEMPNAQWHARGMSRLWPWPRVGGLVLWRLHRSPTVWPVLDEGVVG